MPGTGGGAGEVYWWECRRGEHWGREECRVGFIYGRRIGRGDVITECASAFGEQRKIERSPEKWSPSENRTWSELPRATNRCSLYDVVRAIAARSASEWVVR